MTVTDANIIEFRWVANWGQLSKQNNKISIWTSTYYTVYLEYDFTRYRPQPPLTIYDDIIHFVRPVFVPANKLCLTMPCSFRRATESGNKTLAHVLYVLPGYLRAPNNVLLIPFNFQRRTTRAVFSRVWKPHLKAKGRRTGIEMGPGWQQPVKHMQNFSKGQIPFSTLTTKWPTFDDYACSILLIYLIQNWEQAEVPCLPLMPREHLHLRMRLTFCFQFVLFIGLVGPLFVTVYVCICSAFTPSKQKFYPAIVLSTQYSLLFSGYGVIVFDMVIVIVPFLLVHIPFFFLPSFLLLLIWSHSSKGQTGKGNRSGAQYNVSKLKCALKVKRMGLEKFSQPTVQRRMKNLVAATIDPFNSHHLHFPGFCALDKIETTRLSWVREIWINIKWNYFHDRHFAILNPYQLWVL